MTFARRQMLYLAGIAAGEISGPSRILSACESALGQKRTFSNIRRMSALPPKADIDRACGNVRFVPIGDIEGSARGLQHCLPF